MPHAIQELVIRNVAPVDTAEITELVAAAMWEPRHHARLDRAGMPAHLEANDPRNRDLYLRHGYQVRSVIQLPDGPPLWTMWRSPMP